MWKYLITNYPQMKMNFTMFFVSLSPWPLVFSLILLTLSLNLISLFNMNNSMINIYLSVLLLLIIMLIWWKDVILESSFSGFHNKYIIFFTMNSMLLFIASEVLFFFSFFWTFFHCMFSPDVFIGSIWPSSGITSINFMSMPMLNSLLLLSSGCSVTWSHYSILNNKMTNSKVSLLMTIVLGILFLILQFLEFKLSTFSFSDSVYGSSFFIATGFHGIHVIIGTLFLIVVLTRLLINHLSMDHLLGMEFSIWYWHFVDVVWLYLFMSIYWMGS